MIRAISGLLLAVVLFIGAPALAQPVGNFAVQGQDYQGTVAVTQTGATFNVAWTIANERYRGVGIFQNGALSVGYTGQGRSGLAIYRENNGVWEGTWAFIGEQEVHQERWTRQGGSNTPPAGAPPAAAAPTGAPPAAGGTPAK